MTISEPRGTSDLAARRPSSPVAGEPSVAREPSVAGDRPAAGDPQPWVIRLLRHFDFALLAIALPVFLVAGLPLLGWAAAAVGWTCQRVVRNALDKRAEASDDLRTVAGITAGSMIARAWLLALAIFAVGLSDREAGLSAAVLVILLFTAFFSTQMALRPFETTKPA